MRFFFAGLLLLNLAFALWYRFVYEPEPVNMQAADRGVEMLKLATEEQAGTPPDEAKKATRKVAAAEPAFPVPPVKKTKETLDKPSRPAVHQAVERKCYVMGTFERREHAEDSRVTLQALGYQGKLLIRYPKKVKFLVYLPAYPSYGAASKVTGHLRESGDNDFQILTIKGEKNSISLGVYSQPGTAEIRRKEIAVLGYDPLVEPVYGEPSGYDIGFSSLDGSDLGAKDRETLLKSAKKVTIRSSKCNS